MLHLIPFDDAVWKETLGGSEKAIVVGDNSLWVASCQLQEAGPYLMVTNFLPRVTDPDGIERILTFISRTLKGLAYTSGKTPLFFVENEYFAEILLDNGFSTPDMRCLVGTFQEKPPETGKASKPAPGGERSDHEPKKKVTTKKKKKPVVRRKK